MSIKDILKKQRIAKGLTMKELAERVGVSEATVSRWESGNIATMKQTKIKLLSETLGINPVDFVNGKQSEAETLPPIPQQQQEENILKILYADNKEIMEFVDKHGFCLLGDISVFDFEGRENLKNAMLRNIRKIKQNSRDNGLIKNDKKRKE